jgi:hypothetical protein
MGGARRRRRQSRGCAWRSRFVSRTRTRHHRPGAGEIDADRAELLLGLARAEYLAGHVGKSLDACELAAGEGERTGRAQIAARSAVIVQGIGDPAVNRRIEGLCRRALPMLGDAPRGICAPGSRPSSQDQ